MIYAVHSLEFQLMKLTNIFFAFTWEEKQFSWTVTPQGFTKSPFYFSQILKVERNDKKFPRGPIVPI